MLTKTEQFVLGYVENGLRANLQKPILSRMGGPTLKECVETQKCFAVLKAEMNFLSRLLFYCMI